VAAQAAVAKYKANVVGSLTALNGQFLVRLDGHNIASFRTVAALFEEKHSTASSGQVLPALLGSYTFSDCVSRFFRRKKGLRATAFSRRCAEAGPPGTRYRKD